MGKTSKKGLSYFPFEINFFQDIKVRKLIKYQGCKAIPVYTLLLCNIYENGYYVRWDEELPFIISETTGYEEGYVREVIKCCIKVELFSELMLREKGVLTSKGVQERYVLICKQLKRKVDVDECSLLVQEKNHQVPEESTIIPKNSEESAIIPEKSDETPELFRKNDQKFHLKKREEKEREENKTSSLNVSSSTEFENTVSEVVEVEGVISYNSIDEQVLAFSERELSKLKQEILPPNPDPPEDQEQKLKDFGREMWFNQQFIELVCMEHSFEIDDFRRYLTIFIAESTQAEKFSKTLGDAKSHFMNWVRKRYNGDQGKVQIVPQNQIPKEYRMQKI